MTSAGSFGPIDASNFLACLWTENRAPAPAGSPPARVRRRRGGASRARRPACGGPRPHGLLRRERRAALGHRDARRRAGGGGGRGRSGRAPRPGPPRSRRASEGAGRRAETPRPHAAARQQSKAFEVAQAATVAFHLGGEDTTVDLDRFVGEEQARAAGARRVAQRRGSPRPGLRAAPASASSRPRASIASRAAARTRAPPPRSAWW